MKINGIFFKSVILFFLALMINIFPNKLFAEARAEKNSVVIAVVDINEIFQTSMVTVNLNEQLQVKQSELKKQFEAKEREFRDEEQSIDTQRGMLTESALREKMDVFNKSVAETQNNAKLQKFAIEKAYIATLENINNKLKDIISKYSVEQGIEMVLHKAQVVYKANYFPDITQVVIAKLNKDLPYVKMTEIEDVGAANMMKKPAEQSSSIKKSSH